MATKPSGLTLPQTPAEFVRRGWCPLCKDLLRPGTKWRLCTCCKARWRVYWSGSGWSAEQAAVKEIVPECSHGLKRRLREEADQGTLL